MKKLILLICLILLVPVFGAITLIDDIMPKNYPDSFVVMVDVNYIGNTSSDTALSPTFIELNYVDGVTSAIQTQFSNLIDGTTAFSSIDVDGGEIVGITDLLVADGGTGVSSLTDGGVLFGSGASAITALGVLGDGYIIVGDNATDPVALHAFTSSTGDVRHEAGGLEADVSSYGGLIGISSGTTYDCNTFSELNTAITDKTLVNEEDAAIWDALATFGGDIALTTDPSVISSANVIAMKPSGDAGDYLQFSSDGTYPIITVIGGAYCKLKSDTLSPIFYIEKDASNRLCLTGSTNSSVMATGDLTLEFEGDDLIFVSVHETLNMKMDDSKVTFSSAHVTDFDFSAINLVTTGTFGAGAITGTSFIIGGNTLTTTEWAFLDGQDQAIATTSSPTFAGLTTTANAQLGNAATDYHGINVVPDSGAVLTIGDFTGTALQTLVDAHLRTTTTVGAVLDFELEGSKTGIGTQTLRCAWFKVIDDAAGSKNKTLYAVMTDIRGAGTGSTDAVTTGGTHNYYSMYAAYTAADATYKPTGGTFNMYGVYIVDPPANYDGATAVNWKSLYIEDATANSPATSYAIYSAGGQSVHAGNFRIGSTTVPTDLLSVTCSTETFDIVDAGSAAATEQDWVEVKVGGNTGYVRVYAAK